MGCCKKQQARDAEDYEYRNPNSTDYQNSNAILKRKRTPARVALGVLKWTTIVLFVLALLGFIVLFVVLPIVFMESVSIQRFLMFPNYDQPENPEYENYAKYDAQGVRNLYVSVNDLLNADKKVSLGIWQVVPEDQIEESKVQGFNYTEALRTSRKPVVIYFHGQSGTRIFFLPTYNILRKYFHVIAFDYRSYGDSTDALLTELAVVNDAVQLYQWVMRNTEQEEIFFWGHSLGTALSTHAIKKIKEDSFGNNRRVPRGLILEAPFSTMRDEVSHHPLGKLFTWLPWFEATILDPLEKNGFKFLTTTNINSVDNAIMIVHAEDDSVIPVTLGRKLFDVATENRKSEQKTIRMHVVPARFRSNHMEINKYPELPRLIEEYLTCVYGPDGC